MMNLNIIIEKLLGLDKLMDFIDNPIQMIINLLKISLIVPDWFSFIIIVSIISALIVVISMKFVKWLLVLILIGFVFYNISDIINLIL